MEKTMTIRQAIIMNLIVGIVLCGCTFLFTRANTAIDKNNEIIKNKAEISFVIDQDNVIKDKLTKHEQADDKRWDMLFKRFDQMEQQQNLIISKMMDSKK